MRVNRLRQFNINGTTSKTANFPMLKKPVNYWKTSHLFPFGLCGESLYFENVNRRGCQFEVDENTFEAGGISTDDPVVIKLTSTTWVNFYQDAGDGNKGKAVVCTRDGTGAIVEGTVKEIEGGGTVSMSAVRLSNTSFCLCFIDDDNTDKLTARVCTVAGSGTSAVITAGTAKVIVDAAVDKTGTAIASPRSGVLAFGYGLGADHKGYVVASLYTTTTIADAGTPVEFESGADVNYPAMCSHDVGSITIVYQDGATANDPILYNIGTVSAAGVVAFAGSAASLAGAASAATSISVMSPKRDEIVVGWIDSTFGHVRAGTVASTVVTFGTELQLTSAATLSFSFSQLNSEDFISVYEADAQGDYGMCKLFTKSGTALTAGEEDVFAEASTSNTHVVGLDGDAFVVIFADGGASNAGKAMVGRLREHLIDIRSRVASAAFDGFLLHKNRSGLGLFAAYPLRGTTHASANTTMATKPTLPYRKWKDILVIFKDEGMYVEDDGSGRPYKSGVSVANREVDVRSQVAAEVFEAYVLRVSGYVRTVDLS